MADRYGMGNSSPNLPGLVGVAATLGSVQRRPKTSPIYRPYTMVEDGDPTRVADEARLLEESMPPNMASDGRVQERARQVVMATLDSVFNVNEFLRNKWLILYRMFRGESIAQHAYGREQLHSPEPFKAVEQMVPRMMQALFGADPWYNLMGEESTDDENARTQEGLCRHQHRAMRYVELAKRLIRDRCIYGTCVQKLRWRQKVQSMRYRKAQRIPNEKLPGTSTLRMAEVKRDEIIFDDNWADQVSLFDAFFPPTSSGIDSAEWGADRTLVSAMEVRQNAELGAWLNMDKLADRQGDGDVNYGDEFKERKAYAYGVFDSRQAMQAPHVAHYVAVDWWGPFKLDGGPEKFCNIVIVDWRGAQVVAVARECPYWHQEMPYQVSRHISLHEEMYGIGVIEPIVRLSMEKDMKRNLAMAAIQLEANPMLVAEDDANIPDGQLLATPGLVLRAKSADGIKPLFIPRVSDAAMQGERVLTEDIRETTGITTPIMSGGGMGGGGGKTATQHQSEVNEANVRILGGVENFENEMMVPMLHQMTWNNQQFMDRTKVIRIVGPQGLRFHDRFSVTPQMLVGRFLVVPLAGYRLSTQRVQTQQLVNLLDRAPAINQLYGRDVIKIHALLAKIFREGFGFRDYNDFITLPPEDSRLFSAIEEHEAWYHGTVPKVRDEDNHLRHWEDHLAETETETFLELERRDEKTAHEARAHAAQHGIHLARMGEQMEQALMQAEQQRAIAGGVGGGGGAEEGGRGFNEAGQKPGSPNFRSEQGDEPGMPKNGKAATQSEAAMNEPNAGAS